MWKLKSWLADLGIWLWIRFRSKKTYIAFRHTCGSELIHLADFRNFGPEFQCFQCDALVPANSVTFRILSAREIEGIKATCVVHKDHRYKNLVEYFPQDVLPHIVVV